MPTKVQAKAAIDNVVTLVKADIDTILPVGVNIKDGSVEFSPNHWYFVLDAGGVLATATALRDAIQNNLAAAARFYKTRSAIGRRNDDVERVIEIVTALSTYTIVNF